MLLVQELLAINNGQPSYVVFETTGELHSTAVVRGVFAELPAAYRDAARLPATPSRRHDLEMYDVLVDLIGRASLAWQEPTHYQVYRSPIRSDMGARRVTILWRFEGEPAEPNAASVESKPVQGWLTHSGTIVAILNGYVVPPDDRIVRLESRWTNTASYNAMVSIGRAIDALPDPMRESYIATLQVQERAPRGGAKPVKARPTTDLASAAPKARRGKWKRTPTKPLRKPRET